MKFLSKGLLVIFVLALSLNSCQKQCEMPVTGTSGTSLVDAVELGSRTAAEFKILAAASGYDIPTSLFKYDVNLYKVTYNTTFKGDAVVASGIVVIPQTSDSVSMLSLHHGTIVAHSDAPTAQAFQSQDLLLYAALGSLGFVMVVPDYLGFGNTSFLTHPYYVESATVAAVVDNLKAAKELVSTKGKIFNNKLFLAGYSQGGYVTMAVHKYFDQNTVDGFKLIASFPAAGGYDVKKMQEYLFAQSNYGDPFYIAYLAYAYKNTYNWTPPLTDLFNEPYAGEIPGFFFGDVTGSTINANLSDSIALFVNPKFISGVDTSANYKYVADALRENSLIDWTPKTPMYMYHGDADVTVPYQNSQSVYNQLLSNGASTDILHFIPLPGADHSSGVAPYVKDVIPRIMDLNM